MGIVSCGGLNGVQPVTWLVSTLAIQFPEYGAPSVSKTPSSQWILPKMRHILASELHLRRTCRLSS